jgi:hypothetical protein
MTKKHSLNTDTVFQGKKKNILSEIFRIKLHEKSKTSAKKNIYLLTSESKGER